MLKKHEEKNVENFVIALTKGNTIKRMTIADANKKQKLLTEEDTITHTIELGLKDRFVLISNTGMMYKLNVNKIDLCNINSTGMNLIDLVNEKIIGIYTEDEKIPYLIFVTKNGLIKKIKTSLVVKLSKVVGAPVMKVVDDDEIIECRLASNEDSIILNNGKKDKEIKVKDLVDKGRGAGGIVGVKPLKNCVCTVVKK